MGSESLHLVLDPKKDRYKILSAKRWAASRIAL
jgi:hypothetical protein